MAVNGYSGVNGGSGSPKEETYSLFSAEETYIINSDRRLIDISSLLAKMPMRCYGLEKTAPLPLAHRINRISRDCFPFGKDSLRRVKVDRDRDQ